MQQEPAKHLIFPSLSYCARNAHRTDGARTRAFAQPHSTRLDKVIDALIDLDEPGGLVVIKRKDTGSAAVHVGPATPLAGHGYVRNAGVEMMEQNGKNQELMSSTSSWRLSCF